VVRAEPLLFDRRELAVGERHDVAFASGPQEEPRAASRAGDLRRRELESRLGSQTARQRGGGPPLLFLEDVEDRDRALFLSRS
jgi:hypothetical protein